MQNNRKVTGKQPLRPELYNSIRYMGELSM